MYIHLVSQLTGSHILSSAIQWTYYKGVMVQNKSTKYTIFILNCMNLRNVNRSTNVN